MPKSLISVCVLSFGVSLAGAGPLSGGAARAVKRVPTVEVERVDLGVDSGPVVGADAPAGAGGAWAPAEGRPLQRASWSTEVARPGAAWVRLEFGEVDLTSESADRRGSYIRVTSLLDGYEQYLDAAALRVWGNTSAYFNGDRVRVEIMAAPNASTADRVEIVGVRSQDMVAPASICGPGDDRVLSGDPRVARLMPIGCTTWLFGDQGSTMLTAGHCTASRGDVVEFNVPLSSSSGAYMHPSPQDQYVVDGASVQTTGGDTTLGNDWGFFGVLDNPETGLTPLEAQGDSFELASAPIPDDGRAIRVTGFGTVSGGIDPSLNGAQKTHAGPYQGRSGTVLKYTTDTTGGNSGSPVIDDTTGAVIGIHTNGGCSTGGGRNHGCDLFNGGLQEALANPTGVAGPRRIDARLEAAPDFVSPGGGDVVSLEVTAMHGNTIAGGPTLMVNTGSGYEAIAATAGDGTVYAAALPEVACGTGMSYYFELTASNGTTTRVPEGGASSARHAIALDSAGLVLMDDFETDQGWVVTEPVQTTGGWERGEPDPEANSGPLVDGDGSGSCYTTGLARFADLDRADTVLESPVVDLTGVENATLNALVWVDAEEGERMYVELSSDGGVSWTRVDWIGTTDGWEMRRYPIAEAVSVGDGFRARFVLEDSGAMSMVEGGVDGVSISSDVCPGVGGSCPADMDLDGALGNDDLMLFMQSLSDGHDRADMNDDGIHNFVDVNQFIVLFIQGCP